MATCSNDKFIFIHVPKTGGSWVSEAVKAAGVEITEPWLEDPSHFHLQRAEVPADRFTFAFVREPSSWYGSVWRYRRTHEHPWWGGLDDWVHLDYPGFLSKMVETQPGYLSHYYELFVGPPGEEIDFIGRFESLADDVVLALKLAGQNFDEDGLRAVAPINTSAPPPECPPDVKARLIESERATYERFYSPVSA